ncbi:MAG TPA: YtxH domain-containing protein [Fimbriimonadales bacterium]|jgi:gas vesicle protein|nr:YtxH domain-containing protein [Fimbriimonadales bacterium]
MHDNDDKSVMLYFLAGVGVGSLIGAAAGILLAPKAGSETREELAHKFDDLKGRVTDWVKEKRNKVGAAVDQAIDEAGA